MGLSVRLGRKVSLLMMRMMLMSSLIYSGFVVGNELVVLGVYFFVVRLLVMVRIGMIMKNWLIYIVIFSRLL